MIRMPWSVWLASVMVLRAKQGTSVFMPRCPRANTPCCHRLVCLDRLPYPGALQGHPASSALCLSPLSCSASLTSLHCKHTFQGIHCELVHVLSQTYVVAFDFNVCVCMSCQVSTKVKHQSFSLAHAKHGTLKELKPYKVHDIQKTVCEACVEAELEHETWNSWVLVRSELLWRGL